MKVLRLLAILLFVIPPARAAEPVFAIRAVAARPSPPAQEYLQAATEGEKPEKVYLEPEILLGLVEVRSASAVYIDNDRWTVRVDLTGDGSDRFAEMTTRYLGKRIAIVVNGKLISAPRVSGIIRGSLEIGGDFTADEATELAASVNAAVARAATTPGNP